MYLYPAGCQNKGASRQPSGTHHIVPGTSPSNIIHCRLRWTLLEKILPVKRGTYVQIHHFGKAVLRHHAVKVRLKNNKTPVVTIQFSSWPIQPPNLQISRHYFLYYTVHKGREKKNVNKKKSDPLGCQFVPHFPQSATRFLCVHIPQTEFHRPTIPKSCRAGGK